MLRVLGNPRTFCDGIRRRDALTIGALASVGGLTLDSLAAQDRQSGASAKAKNVVVLYLHGGAPTQDMFDLKPNAPVEIRGEFKPIATTLPGVSICEHLPKTARWMNKLALIRTMSHHAGCHNTLVSFTGSEQPVDINEPVPRDTYPPGMGSVVESMKPEGVDLPHYVALPSYLGWGFALKRPGPYGGFLGHRYDPFCSECQPQIDPKPAAGRRPMWLGRPTLAEANLGADLTIDRLGKRRSLLQQIDDQYRKAETVAGSGFQRLQNRAFSLISASKLKIAFDLDREDPKTRERYGHHLFGSSVLVARRLLEAGVRFVDAYWDGYSTRFPTGLDPYWDTHSNNFSQLREVNLPYLDQTLDAFLGDLEARGMLSETLVVMMSDFGRTPKVNPNAGRDHWTQCYSALLAGAGVRPGVVVGTSDAQAAYVKDRPVRPADLCATVYSLLGIDPETLIYDRLNRPTSISHGGEPIREILV